ncbi:MAG TPA: Gfo/Idh/MocA family oxidoreductase [Chthonomonadales bacterium]|nr:Gfo/Idh/MocA family oxidoreductase [Chthonomonadales bacterium]
MAERTGEKVRLGIVGCGGISKAHLAGITKFEDVEVAAFCDVILERAQKHSETYGGGAVYDDAAAMFAGTPLDAAYIMIPTYAHGAPERAAVAAGVPFLVEKPLGIDASALRKLSAEVEASGLITAAGFMNRYRAAVNEVRGMLREDPPILVDGAWIGGPPLRKEGDYFANAPIGQWWPIKARSGGQFVEQVIHTVDLARYLVGEVEEVHAYAARGFNQKLPNIIQNYDLDDALVVAMKFENGAVGNLMSACCAQAGGGGVFLNIWCSSHTFRFTDWAHKVHIYTAGQEGPRSVPSPEDIFAVEDRCFFDAVKTGDRSGIQCTFADGAKSTLLALAANESLETGKPVKVQLR